MVKVGYLYFTIGGIPVEELNKQMVAEIDLMENAVYRVVDGQLIKVTKPGTGFGEQIITWQNNKPTHCKITFTEK